MGKIFISMVFLLCTDSYIFADTHNTRTETYNLEELFGLDEESIKRQKEWQKKMKKNPSYQAHKRGDEYMRKRKPTAAIKEYNRAIQLKPDDQVAYVKKGIALYMTGKPNPAIQAFDKSISLNKRSKTWAWWPLLHKGTALGMLGQFDYAIAAFTQSLNLNTTFKGYCGRGAAYQYKKRFKKALADYDASIKLNPNYSLAWKGKAFAHMMLEIHEPDQGHRKKLCPALRKACKLGDCRLLNEFNDLCPDK